MLHTFSLFSQSLKSEPAIRPGILLEIELFMYVVYPGRSVHMWRDYTSPLVPICACQPAINDSFHCEGAGSLYIVAVVQPLSMGKRKDNARVSREHRVQVEHNATKEQYVDTT